MKKWLLWIFLLLGFFPHLASAKEIRIGILDTGFFYRSEQHKWYLSLPHCMEYSEECVLGKDFAEKDDNPFITQQHHGDRMVQTLIKVLEPQIEKFGYSWKFIPVRIESPDHQDGLQVLYDALLFLEKQKVDLISISYGGNYYDVDVAKLLQRMQANGTVIIASSGNDPTKAGLYPARYTGVIGVGAWDQTNRTLFSARTGNDILVPTSIIPSTPFGSSTATATLSGYIALAMKEYTSWNTQQWLSENSYREQTLPLTYQRTGVFRKSTTANTRVVRRLSSLDAWLQQMRARGWFVFSSKGHGTKP